MTLNRRNWQRRWYGLLTAVVLGCATTLVPSAQSASAAASTPWPSSPDWQSYGQAPTTSAVCPVAVVSTSGPVTGAANLLCGASGGATLTQTSGGSTPTIVLDYGKNVGGIPYFTVSSASGSPKLKAGYAESKRYLTADGGESTPWGEGDSSRADTYTVAGAGTITNRYTQGGERYEEITLTSAGTVSLSGVGITYIADRTQASDYQGHFVSSSDELNKIWYDSAYTAQLDSVPTGSLPGAWAIQNGVLNAMGGGDPAGLLSAGANWGDYTASFDTNITSNQAGWMVRGQGPGDGYLFILDTADDSAGTPNSLQEFDVHGGTFTSVGTSTLPSGLTTGGWHTVSTTVSGTALTVSLDGTRIASLNSSSFPSGTTTFSTGSVGFREFGGEQANFRNLKVVNSAGTTLYNNALSTSASLKDFAVPGTNSTPSIVDGARRDRAIWSGDLDVEGPTVYYSTGTSDYLKGSLQLLGSNQLTSGFVTGDLPPQSALHTGAKISGTVGSYSASYSMYYVLGLASYYLYTGDTDFVNSQWSVVQSELAWNATQLDSRGLFITNKDDGNDWDFYDNDTKPKTGAVTEVNMIYYKSLTDGATLATAAGQSSLAANYTSQAAALKKAINTYLFNSGKGVYTVSDTNGAVPQDANSMAVLYGVAPAAQATSILANLKSTLWTSKYGPLPYSSDGGYSAVISPFISGYELQARLLNNDTADAETLLSNVWGHMIADGPEQISTMWENVSASDGTPGLDKNTNLSHGWSTSPTAALSGYVLGIRPVTAGYATWSVQPHPGSLSWAEGQAPTPHGAVSVSWAGTRSTQQFSMEVTAPAGTTGTIAVPTYGTSNPVVEVNGKVVWQDGGFTATSGVTGAHADTNFVYLTGVQPGTYTVGSNPGQAVAPCDIYASAGTSCVAAHSTVRALFAAYSGNLYQVKRASDNTTSDIGVLTAGGYANAAAQDSFCANTSCTITIIYDQSARHNDLTIEGSGTAGGQDVGADASALPVTAGGHKVYGVYIAAGTGYRHRVGAGVAVNGQPEGMYMVASGTHVNNGCCFDYGNVEADVADTGNGHMDAVNLGTTCYFGPCTGNGPWVAADLENGLFQGHGSNTANLGNSSPYVTALLKNNGQNNFALKGGNSQSGDLTTWYDGAEPDSSYSPMHQEGSIVLGTGGDNSNRSVGSFFEGVMTAGYPTDAADNAVQANIVGVGYSGSTGFSPTAGTITGPGGKCVDVDGDDTGANGTAVQLWDCQSYAVDQHWIHSADNSLQTLGRCLDIVGNGTANGAQLELWDCNGVGGQKWVQQADGSLRNPQSGRCLDAPGGATDNGTRLQIYDCNSSAAQKFSVNTGGTIIGPGSKCVDVAGDDTGGNGTAVQLWDCQYSAIDQHWYHNSNGSLRTLGRCLDVTNNGTANGSLLELWDCNGGGAQNWQQQPDGSLLNPQSGRCLDSPYAATDNGTRLEIYDCNGSAAQKFALS